jgi:hypothetical protein
MPYPESNGRHGYGLERPKRIDGFKCMLWVGDGQDRDLDDVVDLNVRRNTVTVEPGEPASISQDSAVGKV